MAKLSDDMMHFLEEAAEGLKALEDQVITIKFDPDDTASVDAAIAHVERVIDAKIARFRGNQLVEKAADAIKAVSRANIVLQATNRGVRTLH